MNPRLVLDSFFGPLFTVLLIFRGHRYVFCKCGFIFRDLPENKKGK